MHISPIIVGAFIVLYTVILGLAIIAFGQLLLAIREIAFNTRKEGAKTPHYEVLLIVAKINNILGWILIVVGVAAGIYMAVAGPAIPIGVDFQKTAVL
jgi:hypothetical protein